MGQLCAQLEGGVESFKTEVQYTDDEANVKNICIPGWPSTWPLPRSPHRGLLSRPCWNQPSGPSLSFCTFIRIPEVLARAKFEDSS